MNRILLVVSLSMAFLSACGGSSGNGSGGVGLGGGLGGRTENGVDAKGNCSKSFTDDVLQIRAAANAANANNTLENRKILKSKCDTFRSHHAHTVVCQAADPLTGQVDTVHASEIYKDCQAVDNIAGGN